MICCRVWHCPRARIDKGYFLSDFQIHGDNKNTNVDVPPVLASSPSWTAFSNTVYEDETNMRDIRKILGTNSIERNPEIC